MNKAIIHVLVWLTLFFLPYMIFPRVSNQYWPEISYIITPLFFYAVIFYINYLFLADKLLFEKQITLYILINLFLIAFFLALNWILRDIARPREIDFIGIKGIPLPEMHPPQIGFFILKDLLSLIIPVIFAIAIKAMVRWSKTEIEKQEIENKNLESELNHLRYQIQPHFFFNSLNNIYSMVEVAPEKAKETIHGLSILMRYLLYDTGKSKTDLAHEIKFMINYIKLMEIRQTENTKVVYSFPEVLIGKHFVAPLLFIPMIENAFKHGVSAAKKSEIFFNMEIKNDTLYFESGNTNYAKNASDQSGSGIGLLNLRKRLNLIYPSKHNIKIIQDKSNMFWVYLELNLNNKDAT